MVSFKRKYQSFRTIKSEDGITTKFIFSHVMGYEIEFVLVNRPEKNIICFPSQIGCTQSCRICRSNSFIKHLDQDEIEEAINTIIKEKMPLYTKPLLLSCMGEGEPSLNPDILDIFRRIKPRGNKFALATTGVYPHFFKRLNELDFDVKVLLSLHAPTTSKRKELLNIKMDVFYLMNRFREYKGSKEVNYVLLDRFNDSMKDCLELRLLCKDIPVKLNKYNQTTNEFEISRRIKLFMNMYKMMGGKIEYYATDGTDISAACGMMCSHSF